MQIRQTFIAIATILTLALFIPISSLAAEFHSGDTLTFSPTDQLKDAYIAGSTVSVSAPVSNDLAVAGGTVSVNGNVENGLLAAGGTVTVDGTIGQTARIAGGTVVVNGAINRDLVVFGGDITLSSSASVTGDLVVSGGDITINGPVTGKVIINGGTATINSAIGSLANSHIDQLKLGPKAVVNGNLSYQAPQEARMEKGSTVKGQIDYQKPSTNQNNFWAAGSISAFGFFYGLLTSFIFCFVLLYLAHKITNQSVNLLKNQPWQTAAWGLGAIFLFPILAVILTILSVWLGIVSFILYILCLMIAFYLAQILIGWWLLQWWLGRSKENYLLDWRAVIVGVFVTTILLLVPVIGWFIALIMVILAMGTLAQQIWNLRLRS